MKFGMLLSLSLIVAASALASDVPSQNVVGILRVDSSAKRTVVAVPWAGCSQNGSPIKVTDVIKTANLSVGDMLHVLDANKTNYNTWELTSGQGGLLVWTPVNQVTKSGGKTETPTASDVTINRGDAIVLIRKDPGDCFYLYGQYVSTSATSTVQAGTSSVPCYNLIAPAGTSAVSFSSIKMSGTPADADRILVPQANGYYTELKYDGGAWKSREFVAGQYGMSTYQWKAYSGTIPAGTGVWYVSYGGAPTFAW